VAPPTDTQAVGKRPLSDPSSSESLSVELAIQDCPLEAESKDITLPDASPEPNPPMSPGRRRPQQPQPLERNAEMTKELLSLGAEIEQMRLARDADAAEYYRLWDINQVNEQALQQAEAAYKDELLRRQAIEAAHNACCPPAPPRQRPDPDLLTEMARLQFAFASNQHAVNEQILNSLAAANQAFKLKAADIGLFEPAGMPDAAAAILFIDNINDAVKQYSAERVLLVLKRCCNNAVVLSLLTGLDEADRNELFVSIPAWERLLRRDFMPKRSTLEHNARSETFKWSQSRTPSQYVSDKIKLLRIAGIVEPDSVVYEVHRGFDRCPELQIPLIQAVKETGNDISHYRGEVLKYQDMAKLQYKFNTRSRAADSSMAPVYYTSSISPQQSTPRRCKSRCSDGFFGTRRMNDNSKRLSTPKPSECRYCGEEFPSRSRLHTHLRATSHYQRLPSPHRPSPTVPEEQYQRAFMGITVPSMARRPAATPSSLEPEKASEEPWCINNAETVSSAADEIYIPTPPSLDRFNNNTGYEGVTFKERGCQGTPVSDRASLSFSFKLTAEPPAFPSPLRPSSVLAEPVTSITVPSPHCSSVTFAETETPTTVPSPQCSSNSVTLAETKTSTTRTSVPLPSQLPVRFSAILPATSAAPRLRAAPPATRRLAALELRFASMLMGRAMICRRITRQLIRWQVRPGRLKSRAK
jgi:hypothetical protein